MGGDNTTVQETSIPEPTQEEKAMQSLISETLLPAFLEKAGFETTRTTSNFQDSAEAKGFETRRSRLIEERDELLTTGTATPSRGIVTQAQQEIDRQGLDAATQSKVAEINRRLDELGQEESGALARFDPKISIEARRLGTPEVERIRREFGEDSEEFRTARDVQELEEIGISKKKQEITKAFLDRTQKFVSGDFSITEEQQQFVKDSFTGTRAALDDMFDSIIAESNETKEELLATSQKTFSAFTEQVAETGMALGNALDAVGTQVNRTGRNMLDSLADTIAINKELLLEGIQDLTGELTKQMTNKTNQQAVALGRDPSDPEYTREIQKTVAETVAKEVKRGVLNLNLMEAQGKLSIQERTGSKLEEIGFKRVAVSERTGQLTEGAIARRGQEELAIRGVAGATREGATQGRGAAEVGLEEQAQALRFNIAAGQSPSQIQAGVNVSQFQEALSQQEISNLRAGIGTTTGVADRFARERFAQPTTTSTSSESFGFSDFLEIGLGAAGAGFGIAGAGAEADFLRGLTKKPSNIISSTTSPLR